MPFYATKNEFGNSYLSISILSTVQPRILQFHKRTWSGKKVLNMEKNVKIFVGYKCDIIYNLYVFSSIYRSTYLYIFLVHSQSIYLSYQYKNLVRRKVLNMEKVSRYLLNMNVLLSIIYLSVCFFIYIYRSIIPSLLLTFYLFIYL